MKQVHVYISGFVQGIGYRQFVKHSAEQNLVAGWVRNLPDERVEAVLQSSASSDQEAKKDIEKVIQACKKGPYLSEVENVEVVWEEAKQQYSSFDIAQ